MRHLVYFGYVTMSLKPVGATSTVGSPEGHLAPHLGDVSCEYDISKA